MPVVDAEGRLIAVFDVDSDRPAAFDATDAEWLERILQDTFAHYGRHCLTLRRLHRSRLEAPRAHGFLKGARPWPKPIS